MGDHLRRQGGSGVHKEVATGLDLKKSFLTGSGNPTGFSFSIYGQGQQVSGAGVSSGCFGVFISQVFNQLSEWKWL